MIPFSGEINEKSSNFEPVNFVSDDEVKDVTNNTLPKLSYKDVIDTIHQVNDNIDRQIFIGKTFLLPHDEDGDVIHDQVKARSSQFDQYHYMFLVSLGEGQATDIMTYDAITKGLDMHLQRESEL